MPGLDEILNVGILGFVEVVFIFSFIRMKSYGSSFASSLKIAYQATQGLIKTLGSMVIFDENQGVSDLSKYEFLCPIYVKIIKFLVI